jgi:hypothetical protein
VVAPQAGQVEIDADVLGQTDQLREPAQGLLVRFVRTVQELAELQMDG